MGSPASVVVAEVVMQNIDEQALATCTRSIPLWLRSADDTFIAVHKDEIDNFHEHFIKQTRMYSLTRRSRIPFLDCLVIRDNHRLRTKI